MNKLLLIAAALTAIAISALLFPNGAAGVLVCLLASVIAVALIYNFTGNDLITRRFLLNIFVVALLFRVMIAVVTDLYSLQAFFCPDAIAFDETGAYITSQWRGEQFSTIYRESVETFSDLRISGWGISYLAAVFYMVLGRNPLAVQMFISVLGAATPVLVYVCAKQLYGNERVSRLSAIFIALFPSMALWSSQVLKDGVVIFFLVLTLCVVSRLQKRFSFAYLALLFFCIAGISAFRFYILFALVPAIIAGFVIDPQKSVRYLVVRTGGFLLIAVFLSYLGFSNSIEKSLGTEGYTLDRLSANRQYLATADSGFGRDLDVRTAQGLSVALPVGFTYLMFAPFPWDVTNFRQSVTIPEVLVWWSLIPFLIYGLWYTIRHRLRHAIAILLFLFILTITYSISQGNVGTAYRQRSQIQVFYFVFISVGLSIVLERRDDAKRLRSIRLAKLRQTRQVNVGI